MPEASRPRWFLGEKKWRGSSVGRARDWKSLCHQFDPGPCHHFFVLLPDGDTPSGFFISVVRAEWQGFIYIFGKRRILCFVFRHIKSADSPPDSPFAPCRGHENFQSHNRVLRSDLRKSPPFSVRILQRMVVKYRQFRTENTTVLYWYITTYNKSSRFGFD